MMRQLIKLSLCQRGCCPTVEFDGPSVVIRDDDGGSVTLTTGQLKILIAQFERMEGERRDL
jgi:hypothetical protein